MICAISLDLDDTLWPIMPAILDAENALYHWLCLRYPHIAADWSIERMRNLRDRVADDNPHLAHDHSALRKLSLGELIGEHPDRENLVDSAFEVFFATRNQVTLFEEVTGALNHLHVRLPLISLSNGNADLERIGLAHYFAAQFSARSVGVAKPAADIFHAACRTLGLPAQAIAHIGDDPVMDVLGAKRAGMFAVWLNREGRSWDFDEKPDLEIRHLTELCDWLDIHLATLQVNLPSAGHEAFLSGP